MSWSDDEEDHESDSDDEEEQLTIEFQAIGVVQQAEALLNRLAAQSGNLAIRKAPTQSPSQHKSFFCVRWGGSVYQCRRPPSATIEKAPENVQAGNLQPGSS